MIAKLPELCNVSLQGKIGVLACVPVDQRLNPVVSVITRLQSDFIFKLNGKDPNKTPVVNEAKEDDETREESYIFVKS